MTEPYQQMLYKWSIWLSLTPFSAISPPFLKHEDNACLFDNNPKCVIIQILPVAAADAEATDTTNAQLLKTKREMNY